MAYRAISDLPHYHLRSLVHSLCATPIGWTMGTTGAIGTNGARMPPQFYVVTDVAGAKLFLPKGNPNKCWIYLQSSDGSEVYVDDYSTLTQGYVIVKYETTPASGVKISGMVFYGQDKGEPAGAWAASGAPLELGTRRELAARGRYEVASYLRRMCVVPVRFEALAAGAIKVTAPSGVTVTTSVAGTYVITMPWEFQLLNENWQQFFETSDKIRTFTVSQTGTNPAQFTVVFDGGTALSEGNWFTAMFIGPSTSYPPRYGATLPGGVYNNLQVRDVRNYGQFPAFDVMPEQVIIPIHIKFAAAGVPDIAASKLPPNTVLSPIIVGSWKLTVGRYPGYGAMGFLSTSDGVPVTIKALQADAGTLTLARDTVANPAVGMTLTGFIVLKVESR